MNKTVKPKRNIWKVFKKQKELFILLSVPFLLYLFFNYAPYWQIKWAFTNFGEVAPSKVNFVGLYNFIKLINSAQFMRAFVNTILISLYNLVAGFPIPILFAILLNEMVMKQYKKSVQTIIYFPNFLSWVVVGSVWYMLLAPQFSVNAQLATLFNMKPIYWFANVKYIRSLLVLTDIWQGAGYSAIVYLAALSAVDPMLYEAATIDGAGKFRQIWHITLPGIRSTIIIMLILRMGKIFNIFTQVIVMAQPIVYSKADVIMTYAYRTGISDMKIGYSMAVSLFKAIISFGLVMLTNRLAKMSGEEGVY